MQWDDLRYLLAIAEHGSIVGAAQQLAVAPSTVYRRLQAFEEAHRVRCFERRAAGYQPTDAGAEILRVSREIEARLRDMDERIARRGEQIRGTVAILAPEGIAIEIAPALAGLVRRHPELGFRLIAGSDLSSLVRGEVDVALLGQEHMPAHLVGRRLLDVEYAAYGRVDRPADCHWIVLDDDLATTPQGRWEHANVPAERVALRVSARMPFVRAIEGGVGIGVIPCALGDRRPGLVRVTDVLPELTLPLWLLTREVMRDEPRVRATLDYLVDAVRRYADAPGEE